MKQYKNLTDMSKDALYKTLAMECVRKDMSAILVKDDEEHRKILARCQEGVGMGEFDMKYLFMSELKNFAIEQAQYTDIFIDKVDAIIETDEHRIVFYSNEHPLHPFGKGLQYMMTTDPDMVYYVQQAREQVRKEHEMKDMEKLIANSAREANGPFKYATLKLADYMGIDTILYSKDILDALKQNAKSVMVEYGEKGRIHITEENYQAIVESLTKAAQQALDKQVQEEHYQLAAACVMTEKPVLYAPCPVAYNENGAPIQFDSIEDPMRIKFNCDVQCMYDNGLGIATAYESGMTNVICSIQSDLGYLVETQDAIITNIDFSDEYAKELLRDKELTQSNDADLTFRDR